MRNEDLRELENVDIRTIEKDALVEIKKVKN